jgi:hypothetical protein
VLSVRPPASTFFTGTTLGVSGKVAVASPSQQIKFAHIVSNDPAAVD